MKIGIIGAGAIAQYVAQQLRLRGLGPHVILARSAPPPEAQEALDGVDYVQRVQSLPQDISVMVDCAGHGALVQHGVALLERGIALVTLSLGALADDALHADLERAARAGKTRLHLASGAIGALDCLRAAKIGGLADVVYIGRKPPQAWRGSAAEHVLKLDGLSSPATHFRGSAREAAIAYPKNANVAAAVALAGTGFDTTRVELIADPSARVNIHEIQAHGDFGSFHFRIEGNALPDNPRSSALAAMSALAAIERSCAAIII